MSVFFVYLWAVVAQTIFPLRLDSAYIDTMRPARSWEGFVNVVPFAFGNDVTVVQIYGNILLGVPMGFGLPFVVRSGLRRVVLAGLILGVGIELLQFVIGLGYGFPYRVVDVNDALLNFVGVIAGYALLMIVARTYRRLAGTTASSDPLFGHMHAVLIAALGARGDSAAGRFHSLR